MEAAQKEQEFLTLFDKHVDALFSYCFSRIPDRIQARELVEETFQKAWDQITEGKQLVIEQYYDLLDESVNTRTRSHGLALPSLLERFSGNMK